MALWSPIHAQNITTSIQLRFKISADHASFFSLTFFYIMLACLIGGVLSVAIAGWFSYRYLGGLVDKMVSFSTGIMLSTALLHALPESFESHADPRLLFGLLLVGLIGFFVLEKASLLRHDHHHEGDGHGHHHGHDREAVGKSGAAVLVGDSLHNFADGILIAAAFLASPQVGLVTALAITAHEIPQEVGDFMVLLNAGFSRQRALFYNLLSGLASVLGGILGYCLLDRSADWIPFVLVLASSSFIYIAVSDLMPQMQKRVALKDSLGQIALIAFGIGVVLLLGYLQHN